MFRCEFCSYTTKRKYDLDKHFLTKKHIINFTRANPNRNTYNNMKSNIDDPKKTQSDPKKTRYRPKMTRKNNNILQKNQNILKINENNQINQNNVVTDKKIKDKFYCDYCGNLFSTKAHKRRHELHRCKVIKKQLCNKESELMEIKKKLFEKEKEMLNKEKEVNDILESREKYKKEVIDLKNMVYNNQREFIEYAKEQSKPKNVSNVFYIQNNFKGAQTMDNVLKNWNITYPQWVRAALKGYVAGYTELIEDQFINNHEFEERPMHCLDPSRGIFMFNDTEMGWMKNGQVDINSVIINVDSKFNEFSRDYQEDVPKNTELRNIKEKAKEEDPLIYYTNIDKFNSFIPPKYVREEGKESEYEKSKKKIIKNLSVKCAFNKPTDLNVIENKAIDLNNMVIQSDNIPSQEL